MSAALKVINLWGGPGSGKSTVAAGLFYEMKLAGFSVGLVTEFAKDLTYDKAEFGLGRQLEILGVQDARQRRMVGQEEWAITDSPLPIGLIYAPSEYQGWLNHAAWAAYSHYDNHDVVLRRTTGYCRIGRRQSEAEARDIDKRINALLQENRVACLRVNSDKTAVDYIFRALCARSASEAA